MEGVEEAYFFVCAFLFCCGADPFDLVGSDPAFYGPPVEQVVACLVECVCPGFVEFCVFCCHDELCVVECAEAIDTGALDGDVDGYGAVDGGGDAFGQGGADMGKFGGVCGCPG